MSPTQLPAFDAHAHIAPDVTSDQIRALGKGHVFAMTRTLDEAEAVRNRRDAALTWCLGVHPGRPDALERFDLERFDLLLNSFAAVGEVGLDKRGPLGLQKDVFRHVLRSCAQAPVVVSIHSAGRVSATLELLRSARLEAPILHWFLGSKAELNEAVRAGAYFSVNAGMSPDLIRAMPPDRILTETDFPARRTRARRPGDTMGVEVLLAEIWQVPQDVVRHRVWVNCKGLMMSTGAIDRVSDDLADHILSV